MDVFDKHTNFDSNTNANTAIQLNTDNGSPCFPRWDIVSVIENSNRFPFCPQWNCKGSHDSRFSIKHTLIFVRDYINSHGL